MTAAPLVSICIPSYNHSAFIERCLDSAAREDYPNKEIVVLDDGSTDDTEAVIKKWINRNPNVSISFTQQSNKGIPRVYNRLIELAKGDYIAWVASDDVLMNNGVRKRVDYLLRNPDKLAVFGDCHLIDQDGRLLSPSVYEALYGVSKSRFLTERKMTYQLLIRWCVPGPVILVNKKIYARIGNYDENFLIEDFDFYLRMLSNRLLGFLDEVVSGYRMHDRNTCRVRSVNIKILRQVPLIIRKNLKRFNPLQRLILTANALAFATRAYLLQKIPSWKPSHLLQ